MKKLKILFFIESLRSSGKERRLTELLKGLKNYPNIEFQLVLTDKEIHYKEVLKLKIEIHFIIRKYLKKDPRLFFKFYRIVKSFNPDIIHVWGNMASIYAIPSKVLLGIPMINSQITNVTLIKSTKFTFRFSDVIVANSKAGLVAYNAPDYKSLCIYNGFDFNRLKNTTDKTSIREKFSINSKYIVCMISSFVENKDYATYIKAAITILENEKNITFLCVGNGDDKKYKRLVKNEYKNNIRFLGKQANVESIINICDIGVLSTYTEGISNSIMEFMAFGKPVVATEGGGTIELIQDGITGFLVPQKSPDLLSDRIYRLICDDKLRHYLGSNGKSRIENYFNLEEKAGLYADLYLNTVNY